MEGHMDCHTERYVEYLQNVSEIESLCAGLAFCGKTNMALARLDYLVDKVLGDISNTPRVSGVSPMSSSSISPFFLST